MFNEDMHAIAINLLKEFGDSGILQEVQLGEYDPLLGERPETIIETPLHYVQENYSLQSIETGLVASNDLKVTLATPEMTDSLDATYKLVLYTGVVCEILNVKLVTSQDGIVIYELQVRTTI